VLDFILKKIKVEKKLNVDATYSVLL